MSGDLFKGLFDSEMTTVITLSDFLICDKAIRPPFSVFKITVYQLHKVV